MKNQKGFSLIEGLLVIIAITLIAFVGYYVWHTQQQSEDDTQVSVTSTKTTVAKNDTTKYWQISEWKVQAPESKKLTLTYSFPSANDRSYIGVSSAQLTAKDSQCTPNAMSAGAIERYKPTDNVTMTDRDPDSSDPTATQFAAKLSKSEYAYTGGYYYFYRNAQGLCGSNDPNGDLQGETQVEVKALLPNLKAY
jgi:Tfp pilus assembly protein PilV